MNTIIRKTTKNDINAVLEIYEQAKQYLRENNVDQWQKGTPNIDTLNQDIENGISYVAVRDEVVVATAVLFVGTDSTYKEIRNGNWLTNNTKYGVIHRIATSSNLRSKGTASLLMNYCFDMTSKENATSVRCDTHKDNKTMRHTLTKNGFVYCGEITIDDGTERIAFEKIV